MERGDDLRYRRGLVRSLFSFVTLALACAAHAGCSSGARPSATGRSGPLIQSYSEPTAVLAIVPSGNTLFIGTSLGVERWDLHTMKSQRLGASDGIVGRSLRAMTLGHPGQLWFATEA